MSDQTTPRAFHIGDILSVTTGIFVSPDGIGGLYDILNYMTGDDLYTHQLPRASQQCRPALLAQHPQLTGADMRGITPDNHRERLAEAVEKYGEMLPIRPLDTNDYTPIDPLTELASMTDKPIIVVEGGAR